MTTNRAVDLALFCRGIPASRAVDRQRPGLDVRGKSLTAIRLTQTQFVSADLAAMTVTIVVHPQAKVDVRA